MVWHDDDPEPGAELSVAEMTIRAGHRSPPHRHGNCEERVFVRNGRMTLVVDGDPRSMTAGDSTRVPRGSAHHVVAAHDADATLVLVWSTARREYEEL
jgi:quercetin dioxygenase-like cupin family protein